MCAALAAEAGGDLAAEATRLGPFVGGREAACTRLGRPCDDVFATLRGIDVRRVANKVASFSRGRKQLNDHQVEGALVVAAPNVAAPVLNVAETRSLEARVGSALTSVVPVELSSPPHPEAAAIAASSATDEGPSFTASARTTEPRSSELPPE